MRVVSVLLVVGTLFSAFPVAGARADSGVAAFSARTISQSVDGGFAVFAADLNGDTFIDALTASRTDHTIAWYENDGGVPPVFTKHVVDSAAMGAFDVVAADFNGDTLVDIAAVSKDDNTVAWYQNGGGVVPVFTKRVIPSSAAGPRTLAVSDLDGDGDQDLVVASLGNDSVLWFENDGAMPIPVFTEQTLPGVLNAPWAVSIADINNDTALDILVGTFGGNDVYWYESSGGANPTYTQRLVAGGRLKVRSVLAVDLDDDGLVDIVDAASDSASVAWHRNTGGPVPAFVTTEIITGLPSVWEALPVEVSGDTKPDLLVSVRGGDEVLLLTNDGMPTPGFSQAALNAVLDDPLAAAAADLDHDSDEDLLVVSERDDTLTWFERVSPVQNLNSGLEFSCIQNAIDAANPGDTILASPAQFLVEPVLDFAGKPLRLESSGEMLQPEAGDWTLADQSVIASAPAERLLVEGTLRVPSGAGVAADTAFPAVIGGQLDLGGASGLDVNADVSVRTRRGFTETELTALADGARSIVAADLDGDGDTDLAGASQLDDTVRWFENDGALVPSYIEHVVSAVSARVRTVVAADVTGDGRVDLVAASRSDDTVRLFVNAGGSPAVFTEQIISSAINRAWGLLASDLDGDGDQDLIVGVDQASGVTLFENTGGDPVTFNEHPMIATTGVGTFVIRAADLDADADLDVLLTAGSGGEVTWLRNEGGLAFTEFPVTQALDEPRSAIPADMDGDGDLDVVTASRADNTIAWFENDGAPVPGFGVQHTLSTSALGARWAQPVDLDGDGDPDVVASSDIDDSITLHENTGGGVFVPRVLSNAGDEPRDVIAADLNGDGNLDVAFSAFGNDRFGVVTFTGFPVVGIDGAGADLFSAGSVSIERGGVRVGAGASLTSPVEVRVTPLTGELTGEGVIGAPVLRSGGRVVPGGQSGLGPLVVSGGYEQSVLDGPDVRTGLLEVRVAYGKGVPASDELNIAGAATLAGGLVVSADPGFDPPLGTVFPVLNAGALAGGFDAAVLPGLTGNKFLRVVTDGGGATVSLVVESLTGEDVQLADSQTEALTGLPTGAVLADVLGFEMGGTPSGPDGLPDLVISLPDALSPAGQPGQVVMLVNAGTGGDSVWDGFSGGAVALPVGVNPVAVDAGDLNNDGFVDLVIANRGSGDITPVVAVGDGTFTVFPAVPMQEQPRDVVVADFNGDLFADVATAGTDNTGAAGEIVSRVTSAARGAWAGFGPAVSQNVGGALVSIDAGDLDNDKDLDIVTADRTGSNVRTHRNTSGAGRGVWGGFMIGAPIPTGAGPISVDAGDLDNDKDLDLITADTTGGTVSVLINTGGVFGASASLPAGSRPKSLTVADLDQDGDTDVAVIVDDPMNPGERLLRVLRNDVDVPGGTVALAAALDAPSTERPLLALAGDVDQDGDADLLTVNQDPAGGARGGVGGSATVLLLDTPACPGDLTGDGSVSGADLALLLAGWGGSGPADLTGDGLVSGGDLAVLLAAWGVCP